MKLLKLPLLLALIGLIPLTAFSQNWFEGNPSWHYDFDCFTFEESHGSNTMTFVKDTLIDGITMNHIDEKIHRSSVGQYASNSTTHRDVFLYEMEEQIWEYHPSAEDHSLIYDFSLVQGDILFEYLNSDSYCGNTIYFIVDTVGYLSINNSELKYQDIQIDFQDENVTNEQVRVIEKVGAVNGYYDLTKFAFKCLLDACPPSRFECYNNEDLDLKYPENVECNFTSVDFLPGYSELKIKPNPARDYIELEGQENIKSVQIFDFKGNVVNGFKKIQNKIDLDMLPGIYFIRVIGGDGEIYIGKFVKV